MLNCTSNNLIQKTAVTDFLHSFQTTYTYKKMAKVYLTISYILIAIMGHTNNAKTAIYMMNFAGNARR